MAAKPTPSSRMSAAARPGAGLGIRAASFPLPQRVLLLTDDSFRAAELTAELRRQGLDVSLAPSPDAVAGALASSHPDALLADARSRWIDHDAAALRAVRAAARDAGTPVILLGDHATLGHWDLLLEADDFALEPLQAAEVVTRVALLALRSGEHPHEETVVAGRMTLDLIAHKVLVNGREIYLTHREFELVRFLVMHRGRVVTREMIVQHLWGSDAAGGLRTVDVHVRRIRGKLEPNGRRFIETVRNVGYKFVAE